MSLPVIVRVSHRYPAAAERVFDAWLTPSQASRFLFATRTGCIMQCLINPVEGGKFMVTDRRPLADDEESVMDVVHRGTFLTIDRPRRLVFAFSVPAYGEDDTVVALDFKPLSPNACELVLTHDMGASEDAQAMAGASQRGWTRMLDNLERSLFPKRIGLQL